MASTSGEPNAAETGDRGGATTLSDVPGDVIQAHILTRLDGPALAAAASTCSQLRGLSSQPHLWAHACHARWPSTLSPRVRHVISTFPNGARSFFADTFPSPKPAKLPPNPDRTTELISAVDLFLGPRVIFSKVVETETVTGWFRCSPFRIDMVGEKEAVRAGVGFPVDEETCRELRLSWILVEAKGRRAADVSSGRAVEVRRHWLSGEVEARFATAVAEGAAVCSAVVRWGPEMEVREVSLQMEDVDGVHMVGRDSLVILEKVLEGERKGKKELEGGEGYREFLKRKKERKEWKVRAEGRLDMLCVAFAIFATLMASLFLFSKSN
ncbi:probable F-box protein At2g36090 [Cajanus cajan]|uniref:probable F-box protein At2g36090 n=1 Tax=Cajanus cajan TaxID=3821 RepID=UPI00098D9A44|nr:probable F-box protein At2g36090 [Cajanus cajan]